MRQLCTVIIAAVTLSHTIAPADAQVAAPPGAIPASGLSRCRQSPCLASGAAPSVGSRHGTSIKPELFPAAFAAALADEHREIEAISGNTQPPTFENTIAAMERAGRPGTVSCGCSPS